VRAISPRSDSWPRLAIPPVALTIIPFPRRPSEPRMQKSKARRKAAKKRRKTKQNTTFKTRRVSSKERFK
jgi:hypothetical protein